jgi:uncharacterized membrane protein
MLGMLGLVFSDAGVGKAVAHVTTSYISLDCRLVAVYCIGMALFTANSPSPRFRNSPIDIPSHRRQ